jgi:FKBP-type peptidyl-prolyl cis-trans isomerase (trigger factor)
MHQRLHERLADDNAFKDAVKQDIGDREFTESNKRFILEEVVISHLIRQQRVSFPKSLIETESWRLIAYRDSPLQADAYQWNNNVLETFDNDNPFEQAQYNTDAEQVELLDATTS